VAGGHDNVKQENRIVSVGPNGPRSSLIFDSVSFSTSKPEAQWIRNLLVSRTPLYQLHRPKPNYLTDRIQFFSVETTRLFSTD
ncbi:MAG: hypothetical protein WBY75_08240, partial [Terracidiphilus sp.]